MNMTRQGAMGGQGFADESWAAGESWFARMARLQRYAWSRQFVAGRTVLDWACGTGDGSTLLAGARAQRVIGVEFAGPAVARARRACTGTPGLEIVLASGTAVPLPDASVDLVLALTPLAADAPLEAWLQEVRRLLRPQGLLLLAWRPVPAGAAGEGDVATLIARHFPHRALLAQRRMAIEPCRWGTPEALEADGLIAIAGASALPDMSPWPLRHEGGGAVPSAPEAWSPDALTQELQPLRDALTVERERADALRLELAEARLGLQRAEEELRQLQREIQAMRASRSWRYTRGLHAARVAVRDAWKTWWHRRHAPQRLPDAMPVPTAIGGPAVEPPRDDPSARWAQLRFPVHDQPWVSIVVAQGGLAGLESVFRHLPQAPVELLVGTDATAPAEAALLEAVPGLRTVRLAPSLPATAALNALARQARAPYVCVLDGRAEVRAGWLDALLAPFEALPDCALVCPRLLDGEGRLLEAGAIVWSDGRVSAVGRGDDPARSQYGYVRETDATCGAAVLVATRSFTELGGLDETAGHELRLAFADFAMRLRRHGLKAYYQPAADVACPRGEDGAGAEGDARLAARLSARWAAALQAEHAPPGERGMLARDRSRTRRHLLIVDHGVPQPDRDGGSRTMVQFVKTFLDLGWNVKFWPENLQWDPVYTPALQQWGVEVVHGAEHAGRFGTWMKDNGRHFDAVLLSRPQVAEAFIGDVRAHCAGRVLYYGHDVHHLRVAEQRRLRPHELQLAAEERRWRELELRVWSRVDEICYPSASEAAYVAEHVAREGWRAQVRHVQAYYFERIAAPAPEPGELERRRDLVFVAGFGHRPNVDAAQWFCREVLPRLHAEWPDLVLWLVGSNPTPEVLALAGPKVRVTGYVSDAELAAHYANARVVVAPMRFGAGVKSKVVEALAHGCPVVTTSIGYQGLAGLAEAVPAADTAETFAASTLQLLCDDAAWLRSRRIGTDFVRSHFSRASMRRSFDAELRAAA